MRAPALFPSWRLPALALGALLGAAAAPSLAAEAEAPVYSLAADAASGFTFAAPQLDLAAADSTATWFLAAKLLHRVEAPGWGLVLNHDLELSGLTAGAAPVIPSLAIHEAYLRLDLGEAVQFFIGKRRLGLGIGSVFAPGNQIDPRSGFWDQKTGFRGLALAGSLGSDLSLRAALSLERNLEAYAAGLRAKAAGHLGAAETAYRESLGSAASPADPRLLTTALSAELQRGALQLAAAGVFRPEAVARPSLGLSLDLAGLILQAEGAVELLAGEASPDRPAWFGAAGARRSWSGERLSATLAIDYTYNGSPGDLLPAAHYLLPALILDSFEAWTLTARALVEPESLSALISALLALHPVPGYDLECTCAFSLGEGEGATTLPGPPLPGPGSPVAALGLAARVHF